MVRMYMHAMYIRIYAYANIYAWFMHRPTSRLMKLKLDDRGVVCSLMRAQSIVARRLHVFLHCTYTCIHDA